MNTKSFLILRLAAATSMFCHGLVRFSKLSAFSNGMVKSFENSMLPDFSVEVFSYALPFCEFIVGCLLLFGFFTKQALYAGSVIMLFLIFGSTLIEEFSALPSQFIHIAFFALLLNFIKSNSIALDTIIKNK